jgi:hypothetical protein
MSDLAPFVAAAIRDKVVEDLMKENAALKLRLSRTKQIEVTGPGGKPVYASANLEQGEYGGGGSTWNLELVGQGEGFKCAVVPLTCVEIHVGGAVWSSFDPLECYHSLDFLEGCYDENGMGLFEVSEDDYSSSQGFSILSSMQIRFGPFLSEEAYRNFNVMEAEYEDIIHMSFRGSSLCFSVVKIKDMLKNVGIYSMDAEEAAEQRRRAAITFQEMIHDPRVVGDQMDEDEDLVEEEE